LDLVLVIHGLRFFFWAVAGLSLLAT
jgi:hypothetical protein